MPSLRPGKLCPDKSAGSDASLWCQAQIGFLHGSVGDWKTSVQTMASPYRMALENNHKQRPWASPCSAQVLAHPGICWCPHSSALGVLGLSSYRALLGAGREFLLLSVALFAWCPSALDLSASREGSCDANTCTTLKSPGPEFPPWGLNVFGMLNSVRRQDLSNTVGWGLKNSNLLPMGLEVGDSRAGCSQTVC